MNTVGDITTISETIFERLKQISMTQKEFAEFAHVSKRTVERWEYSKEEITTDKGITEDSEIIMRAEEETTITSNADLILTNDQDRKNSQRSKKKRKRIRKKTLVLLIYLSISLIKNN